MRVLIASLSCIVILLVLTTLGSAEYLRYSFEVEPGQLADVFEPIPPSEFIHKGKALPVPTDYIIGGVRCEVVEIFKENKK